MPVLLALRPPGEQRLKVRGGLALHGAVLGNLDALQLQPVVPLAKREFRLVHPLVHLGKAWQRHDIDEQPVFGSCLLQQANVFGVGVAFVGGGEPVRGIHHLARLQ